MCVSLRVCVCVCVLLLLLFSCSDVFLGLDYVRFSRIRSSLLLSVCSYQFTYNIVIETCVCVCASSDSHSCGCISNHHYIFEFVLIRGTGGGGFCLWLPIYCTLIYAQSKFLHTLYLLFNSIDFTVHYFTRWNTWHSLYTDDGVRAVCAQEVAKSIRIPGHG